MNASNNYRTGALMENLEGRRFFSATGAERQPPVQPIDVAFASAPQDQSATLPSHTVAETGPQYDGPVSDGTSAQG